MAPPTMSLEDDLCVCFHVPGHKIAKFVRLEKPRFPSQCSECYGAGTGCGWCIPYIEKIFDQVRAGALEPSIGMSSEEYRTRRQGHLLSKRAAAKVTPLLDGFEQDSGDAD